MPRTGQAARAALRPRSARRRLVADQASVVSSTVRSFGGAAQRALACGVGGCCRWRPSFFPARGSSPNTPHAAAARLATPRLLPPPARAARLAAPKRVAEGHRRAAADQLVDSRERPRSSQSTQWRGRRGRCVKGASQRRVARTERATTATSAHAKSQTGPTETIPLGSHSRAARY